MEQALELVSFRDEVVDGVGWLAGSGGATLPSPTRALAPVGLQADPLGQGPEDRREVVRGAEGDDSVLLP